MTIYVAYNGWGDLVAEASTYWTIIQRIRALGYDEDEVLIGRVTP